MLQENNRKDIMKKLTVTEIREVQMKIMDVIHEFCIENDIKYSLSDGTLIGAVRHKGYIPWDDDIDIYMLREDYERFEKLYPNVLKDNYVLSSMYRDDKWHLTFAKVWDNRTLTDISSKNTQSYGVFVDIFPIDDVPNNLCEWKKYMRSMKLRNKILTNRFRRLSKQRTFFNNIGIIAIKLFTFWMSSKKVLALMDSYAQKYNNKGYHYCYENSYGPCLKSPFPKDLFNKLSYYQFENRKYLAFEDANQYLTLSYGDYMKLPPEKDRVHHEEIAYWLE